MILCGALIPSVHSLDGDGTWGTRSAKQVSRELLQRGGALLNAQEFSFPILGEELEGVLILRRVCFMGLPFGLKLVSNKGEEEVRFVGLPF